MKLPLIGLITIIALTGCASKNDAIVMSDSSPQQYDLRDYDYDGVIEAREQCAETTLGAQINNYGCPSEETEYRSVRLDVKFANDSADILPSAYSRIERLADFMEEFSDISVTIEGHASRTGTSERNLELSQLRSQAIVDALVGIYGIEASRLQAIGYGDTQPLVDGDTEDAHQQNRRVMATMSRSFTQTQMKWTIFNFY